MAILIEKKWNNIDDDGEGRVTAAVLPSKTILLSPDEYKDPGQIEDIKKILNNYMDQADQKADPTSEYGIFMYASLYRRSSYSAGMFIIEDPQEARQLIAEAGLK